MQAVRKSSAAAFMRILQLSLFKKRIRKGLLHASTSAASGAPGGARGRGRAPGAAEGEEEAAAAEVGGGVAAAGGPEPGGVGTRDGRGVRNDEAESEEGGLLGSTRV